MALIPFTAPGAFPVKGMFVSKLGFMDPVVMGMRMTDPERGPLISVCLERPLPAPHFSGTTDKEAREEELFHAFCRDFSRTFGRDFCREFTRGEDPPDFVAKDEGEEGVDLTRLTSADRRQAHAEFRKVRTALLQADGRNFQRLHDHLVYIHVVPKDVEDKALPSRNDDFGSLVEALEAYDPVVTPDKDGHFAQMPWVDGGTEERGWRIWAYPLTGSVIDAELRESRGFEVAFVFQSEHWLDDVRDQFAKLITGHDKPGVGSVIIQVGAPDTETTMYPADEALLELILRDPPRPETEHVDTVYIHRLRGHTVRRIRL